jgi:hypothetical protein
LFTEKESKKYETIPADGELELHGNCILEFGMRYAATACAAAE